MSEAIGLVLAGGRSSRMGQDKALLTWQSIPLYQHMQNLLHEAGVERILLSGSQFGDRGMIDVVPGKGPLSGVHTALQKLSDGACLLVVPVDMPLLPVSACQKLVSSSVAQATPVIFDNFTLPMALPVNQALRQAVVQSIESLNRKDYSLWRLFCSLDGVSLPLPEGMEKLFQNTNTPEDWHTACQMVEELEA